MSKKRSAITITAVAAIIAAALGLSGGCARRATAASTRSAAAAAVPETLQLSTPREPEVQGARAAVSAGREASVEAGLEMLLAGGNASDAAAATLLALSVTEPTKYCFAGEVPIMVYNRRTGVIEVLAGQGRAPALATIDFFESIGGIPGPGKNEKVDNDNRNATVPASFHAILTLLERHGTMTFEEVARPTQRLLWAYDGGWQADLSRTLGVLIDADVRAREAGGDRVAGLRAAGDEFYGREGKIARRIVEWCEANGALLRAEDLASHTTPVERPVSAGYRGYTVYKCDTWTQGPFLLATLKILENFDLASMGHNSADYIHTVVEAMKLGLADRDCYMADPLFCSVPLDAMLSSEYAALRAALIDARRASLEIRPGDPARMRALLPAADMPPGPAGPIDDTTTCIVADEEGNIVVATPSGWGGALVGDTGVWLNSRLSSLNTWRGHPNALEPGKRPRITLTPTLVFRGREPVMALSIAGGDAQDTVALNMFLSAALFGITPGPAVTLPRFGTSHMTGSFAQPAPKIGNLEVNAGVGEEVIEELRSRGHDVEVIDGPYWTPSMMTFDRGPRVIRAAGDPAAQRSSAAY